MKIVLPIVGLLLSIFMFSISFNTSALSVTRTEEDILGDIRLEVGSCEILIGRSSCIPKNGAVLTNPENNKTYDLYNTTTKILSSNALIPANSYIFTPTFPYTALELRYGDNVFELRISSSQAMLVRAFTQATCVVGSEWNGTICTQSSSSSPGSTGALSIKCSQSEYSVGDTLSCQITGGFGDEKCWMGGTNATEAKPCKIYGWIESNGVISFSSIVQEKDVGVSYFYVQNRPESAAVSKVIFLPKKKEPPISTPTPPKKTELKLVCTQTGYTAGDKVSCIAYGSVTGSEKCWKRGTNPTKAGLCTEQGWEMTDNGLYYKSIASQKDIGISTLYIQDSNGNVSQIKLTYRAVKIEQPYQTGGISTGTPKAFVTKIQGIEGGKEQIFQISKKLSSPLLMEGGVSPMRKGLTLRITGSKSDSMINLPISTSGTWSTESLTSKNIYSSRLVSEGENILTLSVIEATKNETLSRVEVQVFVSIPEVIKPPIETPPVTPRNPDCIGTSSTTCTGKTEAIVVDRFSEDAIDTSGLDAASKKRIDLIISRIETRISKMNTSDALDLIESSISRIQSLPNKTKTMKLVDSYTISRLESLRNTVRSGSNKVNDDYIGLIENVLGN